MPPQALSPPCAPSSRGSRTTANGMYNVVRRIILGHAESIQTCGGRLEHRVVLSGLGQPIARPKAPTSCTPRTRRRLESLRSAIPLSTRSVHCVRLHRIECKRPSRNARHANTCCCRKWNNAKRAHENYEIVEARRFYTTRVRQCWRQQALHESKYPLVDRTPSCKTSSGQSKLAQGLS